MQSNYAQTDIKKNNIAIIIYKNLYKPKFVRTNDIPFITCHRIYLLYISEIRVYNYLHYLHYLSMFLR